MSFEYPTQIAARAESPQMESMGQAVYADGLASPTAASDIPLVSEPGAHIELSTADLALKNHMGKYPAYFDSSMAEHGRVPWARRHLPQELADCDAKRRQFEQDRSEWEAEMEELRAKKLLELRKEVVRLWIRREEESWAVSRKQWKEDKSALEESLRIELQQLRQSIVSPPLTATRQSFSNAQFGKSYNRWQ